MYLLNSRAGRATLALVLTTLAACTDKPSPSDPIQRVAPQFGVGDVIMVTNTSGGTEPGSLRWAASQVTGGEVIRFHPSLAGEKITVEETVVVDKYFTMEGPADKGITISGGDKVGVFEFTHQQSEVVLRNLTIANGLVPFSSGAGIISLYGRLRLEHSTVTGNVAAAYPAIWTNWATLVNTTVSGNTLTETALQLYGAVATTVLILENSTIAHNASGGVKLDGQMILRNSIISNHAGRANCYLSGTVIYEGRNIADDDTCGTLPDDVMVTNPQLSPPGGQRRPQHDARARGRQPGDQCRRGVQCLGGPAVCGGATRSATSVRSSSSTTWPRSSCRLPRAATSVAREPRLSQAP
jgi:hypothetical protein